MYFSKTFITTLREDPKIAECVSHRLSLKVSLLHMVSAGIYSYLPLGYRVLKRIISLIRDKMDEVGAQELFMSALQPIEIWKQTGRDKDLQEVMIRFQDRRGRDLCLGPTHEEAVTEIAKKHIFSYKQLPLTLYQIQTKFRDEARPRFGLMRSCEFMMKDAYSFDSDEEGLQNSYEKMVDAYHKIFSACGLTFISIAADPGAMGGNESHEFMVPAAIGEDELFYCPACEQYYKETGNCVKCSAQLKPKRMIEIGHVFKLGAKYSSALGACFLDNKGSQQPLIMGCYGIGVSRLLPAIIEQNNDEKGICWPISVAPWIVSLVLLDCEDKALYQEAVSLHDNLERAGIATLFDDRQESPGVKFNDAYLIGNPYMIIIGKRFKNTQLFEIEDRRKGEKISLNRDQTIAFLVSKIGENTYYASCA